MNSLLPSLWGHSEKGESPFRSLHQEIDKVFEDFNRSLGMPVASRVAGAKNGFVTPHIDVVETDLRFLQRHDGATDRGARIQSEQTTDLVAAEKRLQIEDPPPFASDPLGQPPRDGHARRRRVAKRREDRRLAPAPSPAA